MMMKYPIGIQSFDKLREDGYVYVDKTELIYRLVTTGNIYFLSRPRRFGKSLLVSTLKCYFQGWKELFKSLAIERLETEWAEYPVFHIDFNGTDFTVAGNLELKLEGHIASWERTYGKDTISQSLGDRFAYVLRQAYHQYDRRCVVLIDEYDKPILDVLDTDYKTMMDGEERLLEDRHREVLKAFQKKTLDNYWFRSGMPTYLIRLLNHTQENLDEMTGRYYAPEEFVDYKADVEKPLPMIYQSGYLTIKDYEPEYNRFLLDFPNNEVKNGFLSLVASNYLKTKESLGGWIVER